MAFQAMACQTMVRNVVPELNVNLQTSPHHRGIHKVMEELNRQ